YICMNVLRPPTPTLFPYTTLFRSLVRGFYYEGWNPAKTPVKMRTREAFLDHIRLSLRNANSTIDADTAAMAVFSLLSQRVTAGRSEEHTSELQSRENLVCRLLLEK